MYRIQKNVFISVRYKNVDSHFWNLRLFLSHLCQRQTNIILPGSWTTFQTATTLIHSPPSASACNLHSLLPGSLAINSNSKYQTREKIPYNALFQRTKWACSIGILRKKLAYPLLELLLSHSWKSAVVTEIVGLHWQLKSDFFTLNLSRFISEVYSWMLD